MTEAKSTIKVSFSAVIPVMDYGNITVSAEWTEETTAPFSPTLIADKTNLLRLTVVQSLIPVIELHIRAAVETNGANRVDDSFMKRNDPMYRWMRLTAPEVDIPLMQRLVNPTSCDYCGKPEDMDGVCHNEDCAASPDFVMPLTQIEAQNGHKDE